MRLCAILVLFALALAPLRNAAPSYRARNDDPAVDLTMEGDEGAAIPVDGIACDNLRASKGKPVLIVDHYAPRKAHDTQPGGSGQR